MYQFAVYSKLVEVQERLGTCCGTTVDNKMIVDKNLKDCLELIKGSMDKEDVRFFFDLDGLLFDWRTPMLRAIPGLTIEQLNRHDNKDALIIDVYNKNPDFFADLPVVPDGWKILSMVLKAGFQVDFASSAGIHPNHAKARKDKLLALKTEYAILGFGELEEDQLLMVPTSKAKANLSGPGRILVDDFKRNCDEWEAEGGMALHMNIDYDTQDSVDHIIKTIQRLIDFVE